MKTSRQAEIFETRKPEYKVENGKLIECFYNKKGIYQEKERFPKNGMYTIWVDTKRRQCYIKDGQIVVILLTKMKNRQQRIAEEKARKKREAEERFALNLFTHLQNDQWRLVQYNGKTSDRFVINREGRIKDILRGVEIPVFTTHVGYSITNVTFEKKRCTIFVHRAVAFTFLENPQGKNEINHKDLNKLNNHVDNIEWCTRNENMAHYWNYQKVTGSRRLRVNRQLN